MVSMQHRLRASAAAILVSGLLALAAVPALAAQGQDGDILGRSASGQAFLPPERAFELDAVATTPDEIVARWLIADNTYLYRHKLAFRAASGGPVALGEHALPEGKHKVDEHFGEVQVFYDSVEVTLPIRERPTEATTLTLEADYQGCVEDAICYPPDTRVVKVELPAASGGGQADPAAVGAGSQSGGSGGAGAGGGVSGTGGPGQAAAATGTGRSMSEQGRLAAALAGEHAGWTVLTFYGFGLLLAFTPCVFPMIPILSGIIAGQGSSLTTGRAFGLSLVYVLAMAVTYTIAGVIAGALGANLQAAFQQPWILISFAALFVALALSMFGFYELQLPASWQTRLNEISNRQQGGTLLGAGVMGLLSALIVGPCVAPPLAGALIYIGQTGDPVLGGTALFALSLGMGSPLLVIGTSAGRLLPKAGAWMDTVKAVFGVLFLGLAIYMLSRLVEPAVTMTLWGALLVVSAVYMGVLDRLPEGAGGWSKLWKGLGAVALILGIVQFLGAAAGGNDPLRPLRPLAGGPGGAAATEKVGFRTVTEPAELDRLLQTAQRANRPALVDVYADWCVECKRMERRTYPDPAVRQALSEAMLIKLDITANDAGAQRLLERYELIGPPATLFFGADGGERRDYRLVGFMDAEAFAAHAREAFGGGSA